MTTLNCYSLQVGDQLPELRLSAVDRATLAHFAGASGDDNPIHIDIDFARRAGMPDVFVHGMLGMAYVGRLLTELVPQSALRSFSVRFVSITQLGNQPVLSGRVLDKFVHDGEERLGLEVQMANQFGETKILGHAVIAL
ncbi:bifunctional enoyl-CoA hydratase/phosphate acetyltransferase [compost metagenome]